MALNPSGQLPHTLATDQHGSARAPWPAFSDLDAPTVAALTPPTEQPSQPEAGHPLGPLPAGYGPAVWPLAAPGQARLGDGAPEPGARRDATTEATTIGGSATMIAGLSYLGWWFTGLLIYFSERQNRFVRFHALQSVLFTSALTVFSIFAYIIPSLLNDAYAATHVHAYATLAVGTALLMFSLVFIAWLTPLIAAWKGHWLRIPLIAPYAERYAAPIAERGPSDMPPPAG